MSLFSPSMLTSSDSSMLDGLTIDELRWLEASEILDFPTSPADTFHLNDRVVLSQRISRSTDDSHRPEAHLKRTTPSSASSSPTRDARPSKRSTSASHSLPTPPRTPPRRSSPPQLNVQGSPSEWLYRRPKTPSTSRVAPSPSALSSTLTLAPLLTAHDKDARVSGNAPFWSNMLRPRSRSVRSIPLLKTIPSQSQVDLHDPIPPLVDDHDEIITISRRSPSISSTSSSSLSSAASSSHPETPVSTIPDPFGAFVKPNKRYHSRHISQPSPRGYRNPPLSSSCPSKSILTRTSSISTKDSAANKSVKFVEIPTVHYASAGYWDAQTLNRRTEDHFTNMDDMGMDIHDMDMGRVPTWSADPDYSMAAPEDEKLTTPSRGLKRLVTFSRRSSVSTPATPSSILSSSLPSPSHKRKSSASTISTATITPRTYKSLPSTPIIAKSLPSSPLPKPSISGPYVLGSHPPPTSPAHSTASLRSTHRQKTKAKSTTSAAGLPSSPASMLSTLEAYRSSKNSAARSVRSLGSIRSESSTTPRLKSWLNRVGAGNGWSKS